MLYKPFIGQLPCLARGSSKNYKYPHSSQGSMTLKSKPKSSAYAMPDGTIVPPLTNGGFHTPKKGYGSRTDYDDDDDDEQNMLEQEPVPLTDLRNLDTSRDIVRKVDVDVSFQDNNTALYSSQEHV